VRLFNAGVDHFDEDVGVFWEFYHQFLYFLHLSEGVFIHSVSVMKEQIILRGQFNPHILDVIVLIPLGLSELGNGTKTRTLTLMASSVPTSWGPEFES